MIAAKLTVRPQTRPHTLGRVFACAAAVSLVATTLRAETRFFCWQGGGGYTMTGRFSFPDNLANAALIREDDVTEFEIIGYFEGEYVGSWDAMGRNDDTSWLLQYDPRRGYFPLKGFSGLYQMWNANGFVDDCGTPGFGFNAGNGGQDVCVDGTYIATSTIAWDTPILTTDTQPTAQCSGPALLGRLDIGTGGQG